MKRIVLVLILMALVLAVLKASASAYDIQFYWDDNQEADLSHYTIRQSDDGCLNYQVETNRTVSDYVMVDAQLLDGDYCWDVVSIDNAGNVSNPSATINITFPLVPPDVTPPSIPTGLTIIITMDDGSRWTCDFNGCRVQ